MRSTVLLFGVILAVVVPVAAQDPSQHETLSEALRDSTASINLRYRYEIVADDAFRP